jgi:hypothetical protein
MNQLYEATGELGLNVVDQWYVSRVPDRLLALGCAAGQAVLVDRNADRLVIKGAPKRTVELARRAAQNREVLDRLETS